MGKEWKALVPSLLVGLPSAWLVEVRYGELSGLLLLLLLQEVDLSIHFPLGRAFPFCVLSIGCDGSNHQRLNGSFFSQTLSLYLLWLIVRWYYLNPPNSPNDI